MARTYTVEVGGLDYRGSTANAKNQFEALHIAMRTGVVVHLKDQPSDMALVAMLGSIQYDDLKRLVGLLVKDNLQREDDNVPVAENLFGDNIQDYYLLIGHAIRENLSPFWKLRRPTESKAGATEPKA